MLSPPICARLAKQTFHQQLWPSPVVGIHSVRLLPKRRRLAHSFDASPLLGDMP